MQSMIWLFFLNFFINFCSGIFISMLPHIDIENVGYIAVSFIVAKAIFTIPAGYFSDKFGHWHIILPTMILQTAGLYITFSNQEFAMFGRALEGIALACGSVASVSLLLFATRSKLEFASQLKKLFAFSSVGFILGPVAGFLFIPYGVSNILLVLTIASALLTLIQIFIKAPKTVNNFTDNDESTPLLSLKIVGILILAVGTIKGLGRSFEPLISYWSQFTLELAPTMSSATFLVLGVSFFIGTLLSTHKKFWLLFSLGFIGLILLETSLNNSPNLWLISVGAFGVWYGFSLTYGLASLGWRKTEKIGVYNSLWMILTEAPGFVLPILYWKLRDLDSTSLRLGTSFALVILILLCYAFARRSQNANQ